MKGRIMIEGGWSELVISLFGPGREEEICWSLEKTS
jgi:hypothetical protein